MRPDGEAASNQNVFHAGPGPSQTVQARDIHGGVHYYGSTPPPVPSTPVPPPTGWTDLPTLPPEIHSLLHAQTQTALNLPYQLPGARRPSLETVYVRQELSTGVEDTGADQVRPMPMLDDRDQLIDLPTRTAPRLSVRPPARTARQALDENDHLLVTGGPGQGKSTMSLRLAADIATRWTSPGAEDPLTEPVIPLRLPARELAARLNLPFPQALAESTAVEYGALLHSIIPAPVFATRIAGCRWLLLVDGLDEVADAAQRDFLVTVLAHWCTDSYRILLTTRPVEGAALAPLHRIGAARYELQPFDEETLHRFARSWFGDEDESDRFVHQLRESYLDELVRVPLLATITAIIFEQHPDRPLPDNQYELYETYLRYLRTARDPSPFDAIRQPLLEHLGRVRLETETSLITTATVWATDHLLPKDRTDDWPERLIAYLAAVGPLTRRGPDLRFLHHSFAEHLAATAKARCLPGEFDPEREDFAHLLHAARPKEPGRLARLVLLHHTHLHPAEADQLLRWLNRGDADQHVLAARLLALHLPASPEAIGEFLVIARAWASTTNYPNLEILSQTSRAAHHPGLAGWLLALLGDPEVPTESQVEAADALATRLRPGRAAEAVALLHAVVDDESISVPDRLAAAEALAKCGKVEQDAALRGLCSVLAAPEATAWHYRSAAVVLAGLGAEGRARGVESLLGLLADPYAPDSERLEAATGLAEIGLEFHPRCAEIFRSVLGNQAATGLDLPTAVQGLAALGPQQLDETASALLRISADQHRQPADRIQCAELLQQLGSQYWPQAGRILNELATLPLISLPDRRNALRALSGCGPEFTETAATMLRAIFTDPSASLSDVSGAAYQLRQLGRQHDAEVARQLLRVATHPVANNYQRANALSWLASLGDPHRRTAIDGLLGDLRDRLAHPVRRLQAATQLIQLGPEFHAETTSCLLEIATGDMDPDVALTAWQQLGPLSPPLAQRAAAARLELIAPHTAETWEARRAQPVYFDLDAADPVVAADSFQAAIRNPALSGNYRSIAVHNLFRLGPRYHHSATEELARLIRSGAVPHSSLDWSVILFARVSPLLRAELAAALRAIALDRNTPASGMLCAAEALKTLGVPAEAEVGEALRLIVDDELLAADTRGAAALLLAHWRPEQLSHATGVILCLHGRASVYEWRRWIGGLTLLGADVAGVLGDLATATNARVSVRRTAAGLLGQLSPDRRAEAITELRHLAADEFLDFGLRSEARTDLTMLDPDTAQEYHAYHRSVAEDPQEYLWDRGMAAARLTKLDPATAEAAARIVRRLATDPELRAIDRADALTWLAYATPHNDDVPHLAMAVVHDPAAKGSTRRDMCDYVSARHRGQLERELLTDRLFTLAESVPALTCWADQSLAGEAEAVVRDVLSGPETPPAERVAAAAALAILSPRFIPESARLLQDLCADERITRKASLALAKLNQHWSAHVLTDALRRCADTGRSVRERDQAASLVTEMSARPPAAVLDHLRAAAEHPGTSWLRRLVIMQSLDRLDDIRAIRDDDRAQPAIRRRAASMLRLYGVADRSAGARILHLIATDPAARLPLRCDAAGDLMWFGTAGRKLGAAALQGIAADEAAPVHARTCAASVLAKNRPDLRGKLLRLLRRLRPTAPPLHRIQVLSAIGEYAPDEGARGLNGMAQDQTLGPVVRLRSAAAMAELHRGYREKAAVVAREIALDETVPTHVRISAARWLALLSELCRPEARALLIDLRARFQPHATVPGGGSQPSHQIVPGQGFQQSG